METWIVWLIVAAVLIIIELLSGFIASFCLAVGCIVAMIISLFDLSIEMQIVGAAVGTVVGFIAFAPLIKKIRDKSDDKPISNMDALIGRDGIVSEISDADNSLGRMKIDGDNWQIKSADCSSLSIGARVKVVGYDSIILKVETIQTGSINRF